MKKFVTAVFWLGFLSAFAQNNFHYPGGAINRSLASHVTMLRGIDAVFGNPAGVAAGTCRMSFELSAGQVAGISHLFEPGIGMVITKGQSALGFDLSRTGSPELSHSHLGLIYSRRIWQNVWSGIRFKYQVLSIRDYGSDGFPGFDFGVMGVINASSSWAVYFSQPAFFEEQSLLKKLTRLAIGYRYQANQKASLLIEADKMENRQLSLKFGLLYQPLQRFELRMGTDLQRKIFSLGSGWSFGKQKVVLGYEWHHALGHSICMSLQWMK